MAADTARVMGSCKFQTFSCRHLLNNKNHKSLEIPSKFQVPKLVRFTNYKPRSDLSEFRCSSSSFSDFSINTDNPLIKLFEEALFDEAIKQEVLSVSVLMLDEDGQLSQKIDDLDRKRFYESDVKKRTDIVLHEIVPLLLNNVDRWISSRLTVSYNVEESFQKLRFEEMMDASDIVDNMSNSTLCTKVFFDVFIFDLIDDELKDIRTREDLRVLLHHITSMNGVKSAFAMGVVALLPKEKANALEDFSHVTI